MEGAAGITVPREETIPQWDNPREEQQEDDMHEVRKRRIQHFSQQINNSPGALSVDSYSSADNGQSNSSINNGVNDKEEKH